MVKFCQILCQKGTYKLVCEKISATLGTVGKRRLLRSWHSKDALCPTDWSPHSPTLKEERFNLKSPCWSYIFAASPGVVCSRTKYVGCFCTFTERQRWGGEREREREREREIACVRVCVWERERQRRRQRERQRERKKASKLGIKSMELCKTKSLEFFFFLL